MSKRLVVVSFLAIMATMAAAKADQAPRTPNPGFQAPIANPGFSQQLPSPVPPTPFNPSAGVGQGYGYGYGYGQGYSYHLGTGNNAGSIGGSFFGSGREVPSTGSPGPVFGPPTSSGVMPTQPWPIGGPRGCPPEVVC